MTTVSYQINSSRRVCAGVVALAGCLLGGTLSVAHAMTPTDGVPTATVNYGDLDLSTQAGALTLYRRIAAAARQVCPDEDTRNLASFARSRACQAEAIARAVSDSHIPQLAAVYAARSKHG